MANLNDDWEEIKSADFWKPENKGDIIEGVLIGHNKRDFGDSFDIETKDGTITLPTLAVLTTKLNRIEIGKLVKIEYIGETKSGSGKIYKDFKVFIKSSDPNKDVENI